MSSEEEATAANVLSQMSQIQQLSACETIDATVVVGHHCDVETTSTQIGNVEENQEATTVEVSPEVLQQVQAAFSTELPQLTAAVGYTTIGKTDDVTHTVLHGHHVQVLNDGIQCTTCSKPGKLYTCEHCGKKFNKSYNLKTHIRVHTGERPYQCDVCNHGFANLGDLKRHSRTHTGEKPFKCEFCSKVFSDFGSHKRHLRLHTGYKPFKCNQCEREFTRLDSFKNHIRLHTGDRPYKCDTCNKEFNYLTTYKRHLNIHKGEKPYACTQCDKRFTRQNYLANHMNTHTKITSQESQTDPSSSSSDNVSKDSEQSPETSNSTLLQQVTQALGEIIPQNSSSEMTENDNIPSQIVVQGTEQGGEFKVTLAQQLLIAQHILNQAQRSGSQSDNETGSVTTVSLPEISQELAEQIVNQVAIQHESSSNETALEPNEAVQVIDVSNSQTTGSQDQQTIESLITQGQTDIVVEESDVVITTVSGSTQDNAVYVAVDPSQPDVHQFIGEIQVMHSQNTDN